MRPVGFDWDEKKSLRNLRKHGVSFVEASTVFDDPFARIHDDPDHSDTEHREIIVGYSRAARLLLVSFIEREEIIRIISARATDARERKRHEEKS
jgi:uncharacterized DUF497 family protein